MSEIEPGTAVETAEALAEQAAAGRTIELGGNFSKRSYGGPIASADAVISTRKLDQVLAYEPADLTLGVEAGMPWAQLEALLAENGQLLPLDPPFAENATVGGVVACNCSGPQRRRYGTARDLVIGMEFATLEGKLVQSGGMVVKNVTGLDMAKLMIGSLGTLAAMTRVNFKIFPRPEGRRTFLFRSTDVQKLIDLRHALLRSQTSPFALDLAPETDAFVLAAEAGGSRALLDRYTGDYKDQALRSGVDLEIPEDGELFWKTLRGFQSRAQEQSRCVVRAACTATRLRELPPLLGSAEDWLLRAANGVLYAAAETDKTAELLESLRGAGFSALLEQAPEEAKASLEAWAAPGSDFQAMQRLKKTFDPKGLLNPGRFFSKL